MQETVEMKAKILLVEDDESQIFVTTYFLKKNGFDVEWCNSLKAAHKMAHNDDFQLMLLDITLDQEKNDKEGFEICQQFRADPVLKDIPIIMLTARTNPRDRTTGILLGADDYMTKPYHQPELLARIQNILKKSRLAQYNRRYRELMENSDDIVIFLDDEGRIINSNRKADELLTDISNSKVKIKLESLFSEYFSPTIRSLLKRVLEGHEVSGTGWALKKALKNMVSADAKLIPLHQGDRVAGIGCFLRDSSQRENAYQIFEKKTQELVKEIEVKNTRLNEIQKRLVLSEKMAVMGQLAAGVAHELRNPLNTVNTSVYFLQKVLTPGNKKVQEHLNIMRQEIQRAQSIITNLLDFSRSSAEDRTAVNINEIIEQTLVLVKKELLIKEIMLQTNFFAQNQSYVNPDDMKQAFLNLILNAKNAMPNGGYLTITTKDSLEGYVVVEFSDTGQGIPPDKMDKIFDVFFSGDADGKGMGIGLSIVHSAIERNKGAIRVQSQENQGTTFIIELPTFHTSQTETKEG